MTHDLRAFEFGAHRTQVLPCMYGWYCSQNPAYIYISTYIYLFIQNMKTFEGEHFFEVAIDSYQMRRFT